jgi:hypothetical protein
MDPRNLSKGSKDQPSSGNFVDGPPPEAPSESGLACTKDDAASAGTDELTHVQKRAAVLMALGTSNAEIARIVGKEPHTISRWKRDEAFMQLVEAAGEAADQKFQADRQQFMARLGELKLETLPVLRDLLRDEDPGMRLKAAEAIGKM